MTIGLLLTMSCKAQTILPLDGPATDIINLEKPIYSKDVNNVRSNFIGVWQHVSNHQELTMYFYKIDDMPVGILGNTGESFVDALFGYYIYKENGVVIIDSRNEAQINSTSSSVKNAPFNGITSDGIEIDLLFFIDYGIQIQNTDGSSGFKSAEASLIITNPNNPTLQASFNLENQPHIMGPYNYNFSIPTSLVLTKISNTPPPL